MRTFINYSLVFAIGILVLASCKKDPDPQPAGEFDRSAMLANYADQIIIPRYAALKDAIHQLSESAVAFTESPATANLETLREQWLNSYLLWQRCAMFEFGPAANELLRSTCNTFPTDTSDIENNVASGSWVLDAASNIDAIGFPALDYLLHGSHHSDAELIELFSSAPHAEHRADYLLAIINQMSTKIDAVHSSWTSNYRSTFVSATGTDIGSSLSLMVNDLNLDYELIKNAKIGIPAGMQTLGIAVPEYCEGFYSGVSLALALESLRANRDVYLGRGNDGTNRSGLDDLLEFLGAQHTNGSLNNAIINQFSSSESALEEIADPLSERVIDSEQAVANAHTRLQQHVVLYKTDMASALSVLITYSSGDGD
jgi:predicted lipoprotein